MLTSVRIRSRSTASSGSSAAGSVQSWNFSVIQASSPAGELVSACAIVAGTWWPGISAAPTGGRSGSTASPVRRARRAPVSRPARCPPTTWRPTSRSPSRRPPYRYQARILFRAPLADVAAVTSPAAGRLEAAGPESCILHTGSNSLDELAQFVGLKGFDFGVLDPPELVPVLLALSARLRRGAHA
jgi:hypothetical protein